MHRIEIPEDVKGLVFDCDGSLADTHFLHQQAWDETMAALGAFSPEHYLDRFKGMPTPDIVIELNRETGQTLDVELFCRRKEACVRAKLAAARPIEPVVDVARRFAGRLPMAVASGGVRENVLVSLRTIGLGNVFQEVLTADDLFPGKPAPDIFLEAAKRLGVAPSLCLVIEDSPQCVAAVRRAGMRAVDVAQHLDPRPVPPQ